MHFLIYIESINIFKSSSRSQAFDQDKGLENNIFFSENTIRNHLIQHSHFTVKDTETHTKCVSIDPLRKPKINLIRNFRFCISDIDLLPFILFSKES